MDSYAAHPDDVLHELAAARNYNAWIFDRARPFLGRRVLDVGAGVGTFTALAADAGAAVTAVEPDPVLIAELERRAGARSNVEIVQGVAQDVQASGDFDSLLCFNVLEHVHDDAAALRSFREQLAPGGRLLLLVPAHPTLIGAYDRRVGHERRYAKAPLARLLEAAGYDVETLRHVNPVGALGWLVRVRFRRDAGWPSTSFRAFDRLVPVLRPLDRLRLPFGLSLWAVARRP
ncbi:MAG: class I SAM-dependent methyltransferase [Gaiellaceae bacterium]